MYKADKSNDLGAGIIVIIFTCRSDEKGDASCIETGNTTPVAGWAADTMGRESSNCVRIKDN